MKLTYRHGDVALWKADGMPKGLKRMVATSGRVILARGEATGHHHQMEAKAVEVYERTTVKLPSGLAEALFLRVLAPTKIEHIGGEHDTKVVDPGDYWVVQPRRYTPEAIVRSVD